MHQNGTLLNHLKELRVKLSHNVCFADNRLKRDKENLRERVINMVDRVEHGPNL